MWRIEVTEGFRLSVLDFNERRSNEMAYLWRNLHHYLSQIRAAKTHKSVEALYLHQEASACISIDPNGIEDGMLDCRIYAFPDGEKRILYLLCVGEPETRNHDLEYCRDAVLYIMNERL